MKRNKRIVSFGLSAILAFGCVIPAAGAQQVPVCDETLYITLDPYGEVTESSVVKGYLVNGSAEIVDYGSYDSIANMTDYAEPEVGEDGRLVFKPEDAGGRFYFEGKTPVSMEQLPWTIGIHYRLNGVEKNAEELAGAAGLVEITVDLTPNQEVSDYYRNNLVLTAATIIDMDKNLSVEAEGAQVQSIGTMNAVAFFALPGEEQHYTIRIGSDDFSFSGLFFLMVPATMAQLDRITDLREVKSTVEDSADAVSDSLDVVLDTLGGMSKSIGDTADGIRQLDQTRQIIASSKGRVYADADSALAALGRLAADIRPFTDHARDGQELLRKVNVNLNNLVKALDDLSPELGDLRDHIRSLRDDLDQIHTLLNSPAAAAMGAQLDALLAKTKQDLDALKGSMNPADPTSLKGLTGLKAILPSLMSSLSSLGTYSASLAADLENGELDDLIDDLMEEDILDDDELAGLLRNRYGYSTDQIDQLVASLSPMLVDTDAEGGRSTATPSSADQGADSNRKASGEAAAQAAAQKGAQAGLSLNAGQAAIAGNVVNTILDSSIGITGDVSSFIGAAEQFLAAAKSQKSVMDHTFNNIQDIGTLAGRICNVADDMISSVDDLNNTLNRHLDEAVTALGDAGIMAASAADGIDSLCIFFTSLENEMKTVGDSLNSGTQKTLNGLASVLDQSKSGLSQTDTLRNAKDTVKGLINDKWEEYTGEDTTILNIDLDASPVSFTSDQNPAPRSIQMVIRTQEIKVDEDDASEAAVDVDENFQPDGNILHRIMNILKKIWQSVLAIFQ